MIQKIIKVIINFFKKMFKYTNDFQKEDSIKTYVIKPFMTNSEYVFYKKLVEIELVGDYKIIPQVNLASIINKISNDRFQSELYRNIDFAIFNKDLTVLYLLIELNDNSHNNYNRKIRDNKVKDICNQANIKMITFYTKYDNKKQYILDRVLKEINSKKKTLL